MSKKKMINYPIIPEILNIKINKPIINFNYLSLGDSFTEIDVNQLKSYSNSQFNYSIHFVNNIKNFFNKQIKASININGYLVSKNFIYYNKKYAGINIEIAVVNLFDEEVKFYINNNYYKFIRFTIDNLYPPGKHISDIFYINALKKNMLLLHGASLFNRNKKSGFLIMAPPNTGKTTTTYNLLNHSSNKYEFLGEDLSFLHKNKLYGMPFTSTWGHRFDYDVGRFNNLLKKIPFLSLFLDIKQPNVFDIVNDYSKIRFEPAKLQTIYLLEKGLTTEIIKITNEQEQSDLLRKINILQRLEFNYYKNPLIRSYEYFDKNLNIDKLFLKETFILKDMLLNTQNVFVIKAAKANDYVNAIIKCEEQ